MNYTTKTHLNTLDINLESAAALVSKGFGRPDNLDNYDDTEKHLESADFIQVVHHDERMIAFAAYQRQLWRLCH